MFSLTEPSRLNPTEPNSTDKRHREQVELSDRQTKRDYQWQGSLGVMLAAGKDQNRIKDCFLTREYFTGNHRHLKSTEEKRAVRRAGRTERETDAENEKQEERQNECQISPWCMSRLSNRKDGLDVTDRSVGGCDGWFSCSQCAHNSFSTSFSACWENYGRVVMHVSLERNRNFSKKTVCKI